MTHWYHSQKTKTAAVAFALMLLAGSWTAAKAQITLNVPQTTLGTVIKKIQKQSKYQFTYDDNLAKMQVNAVQVTNGKVEDVLNKLLHNKNVTYVIKDGIIYLKKKETPAAPKNTQQPRQKRAYKGTLLDENKEPLIGAAILVKGTNQRAVTDMDGNFTIETDEPSPVLQFTYLGYKTMDMVAKEGHNVNAQMLPDSHSLNEVVVTALGIKREKKMLGYSVQDVKSDALNTTGDPSVTGALDGKVAGLQMNTSSTGLGGSTKITIRGNSSLTDNNQPLWVVDGVPFTDNQSSDASAYGGYDRGGTSLDLNPEDIESISVLKGANAAALYGSRAGNGVIYVTTKKGSHKQGFGITYNANFTWSTVAETIPMQKQYGQGSRGATVYKEGEDGSKTLSSELAFGAPLDGRLEPSFLGENIAYRYYGDKLKDYFNTGFSQFHTVALGNSNEKGHFRLSLGYNDNKGLFKDETLDKLIVDLNAGRTSTSIFLPIARFLFLA